MQHTPRDRSDILCCLLIVWLWTGLLFSPKPWLSSAKWGQSHLSQRAAVRILWIKWNRSCLCTQEGARHIATTLSMLAAIRILTVLRLTLLTETVVTVLAFHPLKIHFSCLFCPRWIQRTLDHYLSCIGHKVTISRFYPSFQVISLPNLVFFPHRWKSSISCPKQAWSLDHFDGGQNLFCHSLGGWPWQGIYTLISKMIREIPSTELVSFGHLRPSD